jgi:hypothetical protein
LRLPSCPDLKNGPALLEDTLPTLLVALKTKP